MFYVLNALWLILTFSIENEAMDLALPENGMLHHVVSKLWTSSDRQPHSRMKSKSESLPATLPSYSEGYGIPSRSVLYAFSLSPPFLGQNEFSVNLDHIWTWSRCVVLTDVYVRLIDAQQRPEACWGGSDQESLETPTQFSNAQFGAIWSTSPFAFMSFRAVATMRVSSKRRIGGTQLGIWYNYVSDFSAEHACDLISETELLHGIEIAAFRGLGVTMDFQSDGPVLISLVTSSESFTIRAVSQLPALRLKKPTRREDKDVLNRIVSLCTCRRHGLRNTARPLTPTGLSGGFFHADLRFDSKIKEAEVWIMEDPFRKRVGQGFRLCCRSHVHNTPNVASTPGEETDSSGGYFGITAQTKLMKNSDNVDIYSLYVTSLDAEARKVYQHSHMHAGYSHRKTKEEQDFFEDWVM